MLSCYQISAPVVRVFSQVVAMENLDSFDKSPILTAESIAPKIKGPEVSIIPPEPLTVSQHEA
jgi:hypothetical protein